MAGYIGSRSVALSTTAANVEDITATDTSPEVTLVNTTHEDTDGGREGKITFKGQQSGGEESTLAQIQASHDGTSDDEKGDLIFRTNDGSDGNSPTEAVRIDSAGVTKISSTIANAPQFVVGGTTGGGNRGIALVDDNGAKYNFFVGAQNNVNNAFEITPSTAAGGTTYSNPALVINSDGNVGIGTSSPTTFTGYKTLHFKNGSGNAISLAESDGGVIAQTICDDSTGVTIGSRSNHILRVTTNDTERMRIDSSGNLMVGKTSTSFGTAGILMGGDVIHGIRSGAHPLALNRLSSDGEIVQFYKDTSQVGSIKSSGGTKLVIDSQGGNLLMSVSGTEKASFDSARLYPIVDNSYDLGLSSYRFDDIFATNGTIQTSDEREKQQIASLTDAEIIAAKAISKLFKTFKWNDSVAENGDNARTHAGVIAQQVETAMLDAGLDANKYAFWCSDTWWEKDVEVAAVEADEENGIEAQDAYTRTDTYDTQEEAPEGATERNRKGIRYPELLSFIGAATEQRLTSIEARLDALEGE